MIISIVVYAFIGAFLVYVFFRQSKRDIVSPFVLVPVYWYLVILVSVIGSGFMGFVYYWQGLVPIMLMLVSFEYGYYYGVKSIGFYKKKYEFVVNIFGLKRALLLIIMLVVIGFFYQMRVEGFRLGELSNVFNIAHEISVRRYSGYLNNDKILQLYRLLSYSAACIGGICFFYVIRIGDKILSLSPLFIGLIAGMYSGARAGFFMMFFVWISSFLSISVYNGKSFSLKKIIVIFFLVVFVVVNVMFFVQMLRSGKVDDIGYVFFVLIENLMVFFVGYYNAFSIWWSEYSFDRLALGQYSFSGIYDLFFGGRVLGIYPPVYIGSGKSSNIYTIVRPLIDDFSLPGVCIMLFFLGYVVARFYSLKISKTGLFFLITFYSVLFWSVTTNILTYTSVIFGLLVSYIVFARYSVLDSPNV